MGAEPRAPTAHTMTAANAFCLDAVLAGCYDADEHRGLGVRKAGGILYGNRAGRCKGQHVRAEAL